MENFKPNIAKKVQETIKPETKEYRDGLAEDLKTLRNINPDVAQEFLYEKQATEQYQNAQEDIQGQRNEYIEQNQSVEKYTYEELNEMYQEAYGLSYEELQFLWEHESHEVKDSFLYGNPYQRLPNDYLNTGVYGLPKPGQKPHILETKIERDEYLNSQLGKFVGLFRDGLYSINQKDTNIFLDKVARDDSKVSVLINKEEGIIQYSGGIITLANGEEVPGRVGFNNNIYQSGRMISITPESMYIELDPSSLSRDSYYKRIHTPFNAKKFLKEDSGIELALVGDVFSMKINFANMIEDFKEKSDEEIFQKIKEDSYLKRLFSEDVYLSERMEVDLESLTEFTYKSEYDSVE